MRLRRNNQPESEEASLLRMLRSRRTEVRQQALDHFAERGRDAIAAILFFVESETKQRKRRNTQFARLWFALMVLAFVFMVCRRDYQPLGSLLYCCALAMPLLNARFSRISSAHKRAATLLAGIADKQLAGALIDLLAVERKAAVEALTRVLPTLQASDASQLNAHRRSALYFGLDMQFMDEEKLTADHAVYAVAIVKALEQVGDEKALQYVQKLTELRAFSTAQKQVVQAAKDCLPFLQQRAEQAKIGSTLLRASSAEEQPADHLLRPLEAQPSEAPNELLRAGTSNASSEHDGAAR